MGDLSSSDIREAVRDRYAAAARRSAESEGCCGADPGTSCCGPADIATEPFGAALYGAEASEAPEAAVAASLGCGVPTAVADEDMDDGTRADMQQWTGCIAGALTRAEFEYALTAAGLVDVLRDAGIVESERQGLWAYYYVIPGALDELTGWLS